MEEESCENIGENHNKGEENFDDRLVTYDCGVDSVFSESSFSGRKFSNDSNGELERQVDGMRMDCKSFRMRPRCDRDDNDVIINEGQEENEQFKDQYCIELMDVTICESDNGTNHALLPC